ncbi:MAG: hypothetical protein Q4D26_10625 [Clostridia bacterium]|nr:hypothetical protein [Clostridia bacterium]
MLKDYSQFEDILSNFKKVSNGGEGNQSMIDSASSVYNFDKMAKIYAKKYNINIPSTNDALYIDNNTNKFYFIEFKSGTIDKENLLYKAYDSAIILHDCAIFNSFDELRKNTEYILVYDHSKICPDKFESENRNKLCDRVRKLSDNDKALFNVKHIKNMLYSNVYTLTINEFISRFGTTFDIIHT